ncbi:hypothetical protein K505DRAFT_358020 [Melanomma pulvis-pyrius CBS 109.77]|uniref:Uncharacterized protein n=1 Tax=Melanomma pulvis-pyrius CBS 109.77 TaxID=1314802 RepID=A0A6A6XN00_9PLEO|nr:hypothetical protein K505DRAFT_358020 [Melanomma pulvis-pyrius CBS 109.77]
MAATRPSTKGKPKPAAKTEASRVDKKPRRKNLPFRLRRHRDGLLNPLARGKYIVIKKRNDRESPFLRLPAEIRNLIYKHMFEKKYDIIPLEMDWRGRRHLVSLGCPDVNLLLTCRQIYYEAALLPFKLNFFHPVTGAALWRMSKTLLRGQRSSMTTLTVDRAVAHWMASAREVRKFFNLKRIIVWVTAAEAAVDFTTIANRMRTNLKNDNLEIIVKQMSPRDDPRPLVQIDRLPPHLRDLWRAKLIMGTERTLSRAHAR